MRLCFMNRLLAGLCLAGCGPTSLGTEGGKDLGLVLKDLSVGKVDLAIGTLDLATGDLAKSDSAVSKDLAGGLVGCAPKLNEVQVSGTGPGDEFVEVYNPCAYQIDLSGWKLVYRSDKNNSGGADNVLFTFGQPISAGAYLVVGGGSYLGAKDGTISGGANGGLGGSGGGIALRNAVGVKIDSVAYKILQVTNDFTETSPAESPPAAQSIARTPNGQDSDDNSADFAIAVTPTPKGSN